MSSARRLGHKKVSNNLGIKNRPIFEHARNLEYHQEAYRI